MRPFHLAFAVHDLAVARAFYGELLGCPEGRSAETWIDFDLYGHQIVAHLDPDKTMAEVHNPVDGHDVTVPHRAGPACLDRFPRTISGVLPGLLCSPHRGWDGGRA